MLKSSLQGKQPEKKKGKATVGGKKGSGEEITREYIKGITWENQGDIVGDGIAHGRIRRPTAR